MPRILLVEDDELNRDSLRRLLRRRGYDILLAVDGEEALAVARAERPTAEGTPRRKGYSPKA